VIEAERNGYVLCLLARFVTRVREAMPALDYATAAQIVVDAATTALESERDVESCVGEIVRARGGEWK